MSVDRSRVPVPEHAEPEEAAVREALEAGTGGGIVLPVGVEIMLPPTLEDALLLVQDRLAELGLGKDSQGEIAGTNKSGARFSYNYRYLSYPKLLDAVRPVLAAAGLVWQTLPTTLDGKPALKYRLLHAPSKEAVEGAMLLMMDKQTSQAQGSALTYARRQALMAVLEITPDDDDDGRAASQPERAAPEDPEAPLSEELLGRMAEAVDELGLDRRGLLQGLGIKHDGVLTVADGRKVSARLQEIRAQRMAPPPGRVAP